MSKTIRFAPLIRVSTEQQEKKGESLRTQREQIQQYVRNLGGEIPDRCWEYSGQEHATPGQERQKLDKLLADSGRNIFDAVIVCDASRWSRDNEKSKAGLRILRQNGIRFFVATMEYNLHSPEQSMFLGLAAEINEYHAKNQNLKSIQNRIARAKRGLPTTGKLPYGRTFDRVTEKWGIDEEKAQKIRWAAEQYLSGRSMEEIAKVLSMNLPNLWKILTKRSGDIWEMEFNPDSFNIKEVVEVKIPRLLPEETITAIHERAKANKTYTHGEIKHKYLLSRMMFCAECGYAMFGQASPRGNRRYYRHARGRVRSCNLREWVPADAIEEAVFLHLFSLFGNAAAIERAMHRAIPDQSRLVALQQEKEAFETKLAAVRKEKQNLIRSVAKGILTDEDIESDIKEIREREAIFIAEIDRIAPQLENLPSRKLIERNARLSAHVIRVAFSEKGALAKMSYEDKRKLMEKAFGGKDAEGNRLGVFVRKSEDPDREWEFSVKGLVANFEGFSPLTEDEFDDLVGPGSEEGTRYPYRCTATAPPGCRSRPRRVARRG